MAERTNLATQPRLAESGERTAEEIRQSIAAERGTISETVDKLGDRIQQTFDWREYAAEYPAVALGLAAGTGLLISALFRREPTPQERILDAVADLTEDLTERVSGIAGDVITRKMFPGRTVKAAITAIAARAAIDFAKRKISEAGAARGRVETDDIRTREREALAAI
jgi:ElaB/YqjD/DUF883 family membrane-anchored ribosome-binding protein